MSRFDLALAGPSDDAILRERMDADVMHGQVSLSLRRDPDFFATSRMQGHQYEVIKVIENATGVLAAIGTRIVKKAFVNGQILDTGYLCDLRVNPAHRHGTVLMRGFKYLAELHSANPVDLYFTTIIGGNIAATKALTEGRPGMPLYKPQGKLVNPALLLHFPRSEVKMPGVQIVKGSTEKMGEVFAFLHRQQARRQMAPYYEAKQLGTPALNGLKAEDFLIAVRGNRVVGCLAAWDQSHFRQTFVEDYSRPLQAFRFVYNGLSKVVSPLKALPSRGTKLPSFYLTFAASENDDVGVMRGLMRALYNERRKGDWAVAVAGFHESDPLLECLEDYQKVPAFTQLFTVTFTGRMPHEIQLDGRVPGVEIATL